MAPHAHHCRVYYEDTDLAGIVYYANYLRFIERARTEMLRARGVEQGALRARTGVVFAVRSCAIEYLSPAAFDDLLRIETQVTETARASLRMLQTVIRAEGPGGPPEAKLAEAQVRIACLSSDGRPTRLPPEMTALGAA